MKLKKLAAILLVTTFCFAAAPAVTPVSPVWAKGAAVRAVPKAPPAVTKPATGAGTATKQAPQQNTKANTQTNTQQRAAGNTAAGQAASQSRFGNTLRNIGFLAGGMFLGSMLAGLLGWGSMGIFSTILGLLMNVIIFMVIIAAVRWLWRKIRGKNDGGDAYRRGYEAAMRDKRDRERYTIDVEPIDDEKHKK